MLLGPRDRVEGRASLGDAREVAMTAHLGVRVAFHQIRDHRLQAGPLGGREVVFGLGEVGLFDAANHADANRGRVEVGDMRADGVDRAALFNLAVAANNEVVADVGPALSLVPLADLFHADVHRRSRCAAVNGNPVGGLA